MLCCEATARIDLQFGPVRLRIDNKVHIWIAVLRQTLLAAHKGKLIKPLQMWKVRH